MIPLTSHGVNPHGVRGDGSEPLFNNAAQHAAWHMVPLKLLNGPLTIRYDAASQGAIEANITPSRVTY